MRELGDDALLRAGMWGWDARTKGSVQFIRSALMARHGDPHTWSALREEGDQGLPPGSEQADGTHAGQRLRRY